MMQRSRRARLNTKGFTLIELIIVIVIIGLLAMMAIPQMMGFTEAAEKSACENNMKTLYTAGISYVGTERITADQTINPDDIKAFTTADSLKCPSDSEKSYSIKYENRDVIVACDKHGSYSSAGFSEAKTD